MNVHVDPVEGLRAFLTLPIQAFEVRQERRDIRALRDIVAQIAEVDAALGRSRSDLEILAAAVEKRLPPMKGRPRYLSQSEGCVRARLAATLELEALRAELAKET